MALRHTNLAAVERRAVSLRNAHARATDPTKVTFMPSMLFAGDLMTIGKLPDSIIDRKPAWPKPPIRQNPTEPAFGLYGNGKWRDEKLYDDGYSKVLNIFNEKPSDTPTEADLTYTPPNPSADVLRLRLGKMELLNVNAETEAYTIAAARSHYTAEGNRQVYLAMALAEAAARGISINPDLSVEAVKVQVLPE